QKCLTGAAECREQQQEDDEKTRRDHEHKPVACRNEVLKLSPPRQPATRWDLHLRIDSLLCLGDKRADVAAAHIGLHHHAPLAVLAADLVRSFFALETRDRLERDESWSASSDAVGGCITWHRDG